MEAEVHTGGKGSRRRRRESEKKKRNVGSFGGYVDEEEKGLREAQVRDETGIAGHRTMEKRKKKRR